MSRIEKVVYEEATPELKKLYKEVESKFEVTNMKAILLKSKPALDATLDWYKLYDVVKATLGERRTVLYCDAISRENACMLCSSFMNRSILQAGEDPANLKLDEQDQAIIDFGTQLARDPNRVNDKLFNRIKSFLSDKEIIELIIFGALMVLNNIFNSIIQVDPDDSLDGYIVTPEKAFAGSIRFNLLKKDKSNE